MSFVLVVDDAIHLANAMAEMLRLDGFDVEVVYDGPAAIRTIQNRKPDLIITDLIMPGFDGFQLIQTIRNTPEWSTIPIIILSADTDPAKKIAALQLGANLFFTKPFDETVLIDGAIKLIRK